MEFRVKTINNEFLDSNNILLNIIINKLFVMLILYI